MELNKYGDPIEDTEEVNQYGDPINEETEKETSLGSKFKSAGLGATQGLTAGFGDELHGAATAVGQSVANTTGLKLPQITDLIAKGVLKVSDLFTGNNYAELSGDVKKYTPDEMSEATAYKQGRDQARKINDEAREENPNSYLAGDVAGSVATSFVPGLNVAKGANLAKTVANTAAQGAVYGLGNSRADLTEGDFAGAAKDTAIGGALGAAGGAIGKGIGKGLKATSRLAKEKAGQWALKAFGADSQDISNLAKIGKDKELGQWMLAEQTVPKLDEFGNPKTVGNIDTDLEEINLLKLLSNDKDKTKALSRTAQQGAEYIKGADDFADYRFVSGGYIDDIIEKLSKELDPKAVPGTVQAAENAKIQKIIEMAKKYQGDIVPGPNGMPGFLPTRKARELMEAYNGNDFSEGSSLVKQQIDDAMTKTGIGAKALNRKGTELVENSAEANKLLDKPKNENIFSLGNGVSASVGSVVGTLLGGGSPIGTIPGAIGAIAAKKAIQNYGPNAMAIGLNKIGNNIGKVGVSKYANIASGLTKPDYKEPSEEEVKQLSSPEMRDKPVEAQIEVLNQTNGGFRGRVGKAADIDNEIYDYDRDEDDENRVNPLD